MKIFKKDKKLKKNIRKLGVIKQLKHKELLEITDLPFKNENVCFKNFEINEMILKGLTSMNFTFATDIQAKILPHALKFKDILISEKTGSGKTLAYLIPILNQILKFRFRPYHGTCAIVLIPTKELCIQVCSVFSQLSQFTNVKFNIINGDILFKDEESHLALGCTVLFATPNVLYHHMKMSLEKKNKENVEYFRYHNLKFLVLDEADRMLEDNCHSTILNIIKCLPKERQTMILSATLNFDSHTIKKIKEFAKVSMSSSFVNINIPETDTVMCRQLKNATVDNLTEGYVVLPASKRILFLYSLIKDTKDKKVMIFFNCSEEVEFFYSFLNLLNINNQVLLMLHSNLTNEMRTSNLIKFNSLKSGFLLCTDVVSRGIDIPEVSLVVQYDIPTEYTSYIHRVGRTARGGLDGTAILLLRKNEEEIVLSYLKKISMSLIEFETPRLHEINNYFEQLTKKSQIYKLAEEAFVSQLKAYKNSKITESIKHLELKDEIVNFCLESIPTLPKILQSEFK